MISEAERGNTLIGLRCTWNCPRVSHLLFADDSIIFSRASMVDVNTIKSILEDYECGLGQNINLE